MEEASRSSMGVMAEEGVGNAEEEVREREGVAESKALGEDHGSCRHVQVAGMGEKEWLW